MVELTEMLQLKSLLQCWPVKILAAQNIRGRKIRFGGFICSPAGIEFMILPPWARLDWAKCGALMIAQTNV
jgi:hypothetical protein